MHRPVGDVIASLLALNASRAALAHGNRGGIKVVELGGVGRIGNLGPTPG